MPVGPALPPPPAPERADPLFASVPPAPPAYDPPVALIDDGVELAVAPPAPPAVVEDGFFPKAQEIYAVEDAVLPK
jgi:hypothetical protein